MGLCKFVPHFGSCIHYDESFLGLKLSLKHTFLKIFTFYVIIQIICTANDNVLRNLNMNGRT